MAKSQFSGERDAKMPVLKPTETGLRTAVDYNREISITSARPVEASTQIKSLAVAIRANPPCVVPETNCHRKFWLSFFFDGTGNNMGADVELMKHSNVVRLFRAHKESDVVKGVHKIYIPGIGTYFKEADDKGGSTFGLGCGAMGQARIDFALKEFDKILAVPLANASAPKNSIEEINLAVFGFSRGAALARAFVNDFIKRNCFVKQGRWVLKFGNWPVRVRFMGLFDTVASVGVAMGSNNIPISGMKAAYSEDIQAMLKNRLRKYVATRPSELAFTANGLPGADPAPGWSAGHEDWGSRLQIDPLVEDVRHFIAGHELRNSFPLDSISTLSATDIIKPAHFHETVYPGAHSDVGGGYAPGEGAKGLLPTENLALIPLRHMYEYALRSGVPMLAECAWKEETKQDFKISQSLEAAYNHYLKVVGTVPFLGYALNKNMSLFYAWRFKAIRKRRANGKLEKEIIGKYDREFQEKTTALRKDVSTLEKNVEAAKFNWEIQQELQRYREDGPDAGSAGAGLQQAHAQHSEAIDRLLRTKAKIDSLPNMQNFQRILELYDNQLISDVLSISEAMDKKFKSAGMAPKLRANLRPHYKYLFEAFENEFIKNSGLNDELIMLFFDRYVHDSLCGFGKDATLPSDPRVVFMGGDVKFRYAKLEAISPSLMSDQRGVAA